jgi:anti-sigma factor RsiW
VSEVAVPLTCREFVEVVSAYLEDGLDPADRARFDEHLELCDPCVTYVEQIRLTIEASGRLDEEDIDPAAREVLLAAFGDWKHRT